MLSRQSAVGTPQDTELGAAVQEFPLGAGDGVGEGVGVTTTTGVQSLAIPRPSI